MLADRRAVVPSLGVLLLSASCRRDESVGRAPEATSPAVTASTAPTSTPSPSALASAPASASASAVAPPAGGMGACAPGVFNAEATCDCPVGFVNVGPPGKAACKKSPGGP